MSVAAETRQDENVVGTVLAIVHPRRFRIILALLFLAALFAGCVWEILGGAGIAGRFAGAVAGAGLLYVLVLGFRRLALGWHVEIGTLGVTIPGPTLVAKLVPWNDIESIGTFELYNNVTVTGLRLKSYDRLIAQYTPREAEMLVRRYRASANLDATMGGTTFEAGRHIDSLRALFGAMRKTFGYETWYGDADRDRDPYDFAFYLDDFRKRYAPGSVG